MTKYKRLSIQSNKGNLTELIAIQSKVLSGEEETVGMHLLKQLPWSRNTLPQINQCLIQATEI